MNKFINLKYFFKNQLNSNEHHEVVDFKQSFDIDKNKWSENKKLAICIGFNPWKRDFFNEFVSDYNLAYVRGKTHHKKVIEILKSIKEKYKVFIWSYKEDPEVYKFLVQNNIEISRVEDGFIRSIGLGADKVPPLSLVIDDDGIYFDPNSKSKLIKILEEVSNNITEEQKQKARDTINFIVKNGISKYNLADNVELPKELIEKIKIKSDDIKVVLVVGQVGDDESIIKGSGDVKDSATLVEIAKKENPNAIILYRPHPDVWYKKREESIDLSYISTISTVVPPNVSLNSMWDIVDVVYTITSLTGFEALLRNKHVVCFGLPFYSGYGLTEDRIEHPHRNLKLDLETFFYASYIKYPIYSIGGLEETLEYISSQKFDFLYNQSIRGYSLIVKNNNKDNHILIASEKLIDIIENHQNVGIITANADIGPISVLGMLNSNNIDIITLSQVAERNIRAKYSNNFSQMYSLEKKYVSSHSEIQYQATNLYSAVEKHLEKTVQKLFVDILEKKLSSDFISSMMRLFKDRLYKSLIHYFSFQKLFNEYDILCVLVRDENSLEYEVISQLAKRYNFEDKIIYLIPNKIRKEVLNNLNSNKKIVFPIKGNISLIKQEINSYWYSIKNVIDEISMIKNDKSLVPVCLVMNGRPYAYYPAGKEIAEAVIEAGYNPLLIPVNYVENEAVFDESKMIALEDGLTIGGAVIYDISKYKSNREIINIQKKFLKTEKLLEDLFVSSISEFLPSQLTKYIELIIRNFAQGIKNRLIILCDLDKCIKNSPAVFMSPERGEISRIVASIANSNNKPSVSIQHMIISDNPIYDRPIVAHLGVMDTLQKDVYIKLGYNRKNITLVGSANFRQRLSFFNNYTGQKNDTNKNILFTMQHSSLEQMKIIYNLLKEFIFLKKDFKLSIKPHPHQEQGLIDLIKNDILKNNLNIELLEKEADTYEYVFKSKLIVGYFTTVLLEASLYGDKRVLIIAGDELEESIDFSKIGLAVKVSPEDENIFSIINDLLEDGNIAKELDETREKYQAENKHLYDLDAGKDFVKSFLNLRNENNE